ncbi:MAG: hypothetical protein AAF458_09775 [Pseudomonadota bacterium]
MSALPPQITGPARLGRYRALTVLHSDGFALSGAVIRIKGGNPTAIAVARSRAVALESAVAEVLAGLRKNTRNPPKQTLVLTDSAVTALLELPVAPNSPRPAAQMNEVIRWELEPMFAMQAERWSIGTLLCGRGYLDADSRGLILAEMERRNRGSRQRVSARFGEIAQSLNLVTREQIDECLELQEFLVGLDDDLVCSWAPQRSSGEDEATGRYRWLASGIGAQIRDRWVSACRKNGQFLVAVCPALGSARAGAGGATSMHVDLAQEQALVAVGGGDRLVSLQIEPTGGGTLTLQVPSMCHEQMTPDVRNVQFITTEHALPDEFTRELEIEVDRPVSELGPAPTKAQVDHEQSLAEHKQTEAAVVRMCAAAAAALGHHPRASQAFIAGQAVPPPIWRSPALLPYAVLSLVVLSVVAVEVWMRVQIQRNETELARLEAEFGRKLDLKKAAEQNAAEGRQLESQLVEVGREVEQSNEAIAALEHLSARRDLAPAFLRALQNVMTDSVLVNTVSQSPRSQDRVYLSGWAISNTAAQQFVTNLTRKLEPLGMSVLNAQVLSASSPSGAPGYSVEAWLEIRGRDDADSLAPVSEQNRGTQTAGRGNN